MYGHMFFLTPIDTLKRRKLGLLGGVAKVTSGERRDSVGGPV